MNPIESTAVEKKGEAPWTVFVMFDDVTSRQRATAVCDALTARYWRDLEFELHWCGLEQVGSPESAHKEAACATNARVVIIASSACVDLPASAVQWLEEWSLGRQGREGTLIGLIPAAADRQRCSLLDHFLRNLAHRAGLDYLTHEPESGLMPMPDECGWITTKAEEVSSLLNTMLTSFPPTHGTKPPG